MLLEAYAPASVLINKRYQVLYFHGPTSRYLQQPSGEPTLDLLSMAHDELGTKLRSALLRGRHARIFVGAGIVEGSSPDAEWEETELKARALLDALGARS